MHYKFNKGKCVFVKDGVYFSLTDIQIAEMQRLLDQASKDYRKEYPKFILPKWKDNGDGTFTTTNRRSS